MKLSYLLLGLLAAGALATGTLPAQQLVNYHTTLVDHVDPEPGSGIRYSSLTGYAAPDGGEYALLGGVDGTYVYDVGQVPLKLVAMIPGVNSQWRELKTYRQLAYVVSEGSGSGLQILDLSKLPASVSLISTDTAIFSRAHTVDVDGDYLYINGTQADAGANGGTIIYNIGTDPLHPRPVGMWNAHYVHDVTVRNDTMYAAEIFDGILDIIYLGKDRTNPRQVAEIRYPDAGTHNADVVEQGGYVMTTDEINATPKTLKIWDIRDPENISKVADYTPAAGEVVHNVHTKGKLAYVAWYSAGTRIIDVSDPREPAQLGYYDTFEGISSGYDGNWEVYPYLPSGKILASDRQTGLWVFTFDGVGKGYASGQVVDSATGQPIPFARVTFPSIRLTVTADSTGHFHYAGALDTLQASVQQVGYYSHPYTVAITSEGTDQTLKLRKFTLSSAPAEGSDRGHAASIAVDVMPSTISGHATVHLRLGASGAPALVELYDLLGRRVATLHDGPATGGDLMLPLDASGLPAGRYICRASSGALVASAPVTIAH